MHAVCDALGNPKEFHLTEGQTHDLTGADVLLPNIIAETKCVLADKAYDAKERVIDVLKKANIEIVIPPRKNRKEQREYDQGKYKWRH